MNKTGQSFYPPEIYILVKCYRQITHKYKQCQVVINSMEKVRQGTKNDHSAILPRVVCKCLSDKIKFEWRPEQGPGAGL